MVENINEEDKICEDIKDKDDNKNDENLENIQEIDEKVIDKFDNEEIIELQKKVDDCFDKYQRTLAEFDNFRKRTSKEKAIVYDDAIRDVILKFLPVVDNFERAIASSQDKDDNFYKGIEMILKQIKDIFSSIGVEEISSIGEKFDPSFHSAVDHEVNDSYGENEIISIMLKGYKYKDKVIRHSMVKVAN